MVQSVPFRFERKYFLGFEAEGGNIDRYFNKVEKIGLLNRNDPNTTIKIFKFPITDKRKFLRDLIDIDSDLLADSSNTFLHVVFTGKSWMTGGRICTDMGYGNFHIENKIRLMVGGGLNLAVWSFMNCARTIKMKEAGGQEWRSEDE